MWFWTEWRVLRLMLQEKDPNKLTIEDFWDKWQHSQKHANHKNGPITDETGMAAYSEQYKGICSKCGKFGHHSRNSQQNKQDSFTFQVRNNKSEVTCYYGGENGYYMRNCQVKKKINLHMMKASRRLDFNQKELLCTISWVKHVLAEWGPLRYWNLHDLKRKHQVQIGRVSNWMSRLGVFCTWWWYLYFICTIGDSAMRSDPHDQKEVLKRSIGVRLVHDWQVRTNEDACLWKQNSKNAYLCMHGWTEIYV